MSPFCGKNSVKRTAVGIWKCKHTNKKIAGGAYQLATTAAVTAKTTIQRLRRMREEAKLENWAWWIIIFLIEPTELSKNVCLCLIIAKRDLMRQTDYYGFVQWGVFDRSELGAVFVFHRANYFDPHISRTHSISSYSLHKAFMSNL